MFKDTKGIGSAIDGTGEDENNTAASNQENTQTYRNNYSMGT